ncbi:MAG: alpha/beta hydrolase [Clostridia bacterium]|nr:alpha/beta hydrolase [Clostridia bacterium]
MIKFLNKYRKPLICLALAFALLLSVFAVYVSIYYRADGEAIAEYTADSGVNIEKNARYFAVGNEDAKRGLVFYGGAKVDPEAYVPLAVALAKEGIFTVIVRMPFNLAIFGINSANGVMRKYSSVEKWFVGGHSLGGSMAASYAKGHEQKIEGVVLLGSYSAANLSETGLPVFVAYGSEDGVLNMKKYEKNLSNLPKDGVSTLVVDGGNHAGFGMYGPQRGDGEATVTTEKQIELVAEMIDGFTRR